MAPLNLPTVGDLGVRGCLYLAALLAAQERRLPIAPTRRVALTVLDVLRNLRLIKVPWPESRWEIQPQAQITPIEGLQWRYCWGNSVAEGLLIVLEDHLQSQVRDDSDLAIRTELWRELALAEAERFFEWQLGRHQFDPVWAQDLMFVHRDCPSTLSIAQWRYCCWAATRHGASVAQQQRVLDPAAIREAVYSELRRRAKNVGTGSWLKCALPPFNPLPESALGQLMALRLLSSAEIYWSSPPVMEKLVSHMPVDPCA